MLSWTETQISATMVHTLTNTVTRHVYGVQLLASRLPLQHVQFLLDVYIYLVGVTLRKAWLHFSPHYPLRKVINASYQTVSVSKVQQLEPHQWRFHNCITGFFLDEEILIYSKWKKWETVHFRLCQPVLCLCGGRESVDGTEGRCTVIWEVSYSTVRPRQAAE